MEFLFGIIVLALAVWAIINIVQSPASTGTKIAWSIGVILFPLIGFIVWYFAGPRGNRALA
jgi:hypothetical protein